MNLLWLISVAAGICYFLTDPWHPFPGSIVLKGLSVATLALVVWKSRLDAPARHLLTAALALSSLGDILLDIQPSFFVFGLGAFLLAHLMYVRLFVTNRRRGEALSGIRRAMLALVAIFAIAFALWLLPVLGDMTLPVLLYVGVLTAMVVSAIGWRARRTDWILYGAFLFLISDAVLGAAKFRGPVPLRGWIVWGTYYAAQFMITKGVLRELGPQSSLKSEDR